MLIILDLSVSYSKSDRLNNSFCSSWVFMQKLLNPVMTISTIFLTFFSENTLRAKELEGFL